MRCAIETDMRGSAPLHAYTRLWQGFVAAASSCIVERAFEVAHAKIQASEHIPSAGITSYQLLLALSYDTRIWMSALRTMMSKHT